MKLHVLAARQENFTLEMRLTLFTILCHCGTAVFAQSSVVDSYVATESPIAKAGLLANIGPSGSKSSGAKVCYTPDEYLILSTF